MPEDIRSKVPAGQQAIHHREMWFLQESAMADLAKQNSESAAVLQAERAQAQTAQVQLTVRCSSWIQNGKRNRTGERVCI